MHSFTDWMHLEGRKLTGSLSGSQRWLIWVPGSREKQEMCLRVLKERLFLCSRINGAAESSYENGKI